MNNIIILKPPIDSPSSSFSPLASFVDLQRVLFEEEQAAYQQAILQSMSLSPAINALEARKRENELQLICLLTEHQTLSQQVITGASIETKKDEREQGERKMITWQRRKHNSTNLTLAFLNTIDMEKLLTPCSGNDK